MPSVSSNHCAATGVPHRRTPLAMWVSHGENRGSSP
jgi:hypothetical protein